jgi:hypothetical protein
MAEQKNRSEGDNTVDKQTVEVLKESFPQALDTLFHRPDGSVAVNPTPATQPVRGEPVENVVHINTEHKPNVTY